MLVRAQPFLSTCREKQRSATDMIITGVSGQTGAGKSTLAQMLSEEGLGTNLEVDAIGHSLLSEPETVERLVGEFGADICDENSNVCRKALGRKAFQTESSIAALNAIMHPAMVARVEHEIALARRRGDAFFIVNAALLFSMKLDLMCDYLIYVITSASIRLQRLMENRNWSEESARERLFAQDELPLGRQDIMIINNDGTEKDLAAEAHRVAQLLKGSK